MTRAAFLDLNGTLVMPVQATHPREYVLLPMAVEAVRLLNRAGFACPIVTVQSRIAKGLYSTEDFLSWFSRFRAHLSSEGAKVEGPYLCPHWRGDRCACKKPQTLLYREAADRLGIDIARSVVIGDDISDLLAAKELGCAGYLECLTKPGVDGSMGGMKRPLVTDELWEAIEPLLPPEPPKPKGGRPRIDDRAALTGIIFVLRSGIPWEMLPQEMGCGCGMTCWRRLRDWQEAGVWESLYQVLKDRLGKTDKVDWERASLDSASVPAKKGAQRPARIRRIEGNRARSVILWSTEAASRSM